jgi:hypothetical protein
MKRILLLALCGMTFQNIFAQEATVTTEAHYTVSGGLLGALNLTKFKMKGDNATKPEYDSKAGWSAGAWVNFPLGSKFSIEPQLM